MLKKWKVVSSVLLVCVVIVKTAPRAPAHEDAAPVSKDTPAAPAANNQAHHQADKQSNQESADATTVLADHPACKADVERLCHNNEENPKDDEKKIQQNFEVLDCFMSYRGDEVPPSSSCQTVSMNQV